jgi:hypothetical protein
LVNDITHLPIEHGPSSGAGQSGARTPTEPWFGAFTNIAGTRRPVDLAYLITENETSPSWASANQAP